MLITTKRTDDCFWLLPFGGLPSAVKYFCCGGEAGPATMDFFLWEGNCARLPGLWRRISDQSFNEGLVLIHQS